MFSFGNILGYVIIGVIIMLTIHQAFLYSVAQNDPEEIPYPRIRLSRRIGIAIIFILITLAGLFWSPSTPHSFFLMIAVIIALLGLAALLFLRDLRETTHTVMQHVEQQASQENKLLAELMRDSKSGQD